MDNSSIRSGFYNDRNDLVVESMAGAVYSSNTLARLKGAPEIKVLLRSDWDKAQDGKKQVALISGGGSGHEPAHGGFVGKGMLTAAVLGDVFASPGVDAILAAILSVVGEAGCLLIIKNYTGDRIAFGLAAEKAKAAGHKVEMVVVGDDVSLDVAHPRGIAGTLFIHKIAGAMAERGASLNDIYAEAIATADIIASYGVSLTSCTIPGSAKVEAIPAGEMELGLGIHGEPGAKKAPVTTVAAMIATMVDEIDKNLPKEGEVAVLVNNLGAVSNLEMGVVIKSLMDSALSKRIGLIIGPHHLMTSLDMNGFSLSCLPMNTAKKDFLLYPVPDIPAWSPGVVPAMKEFDLPEGIIPTYAASENPGVYKTIKKVCDTLIAAEDELNLMDRAVGDGDTGTTFAKGAKKIVAELDSLPLNHPRELSLALGELLSQSVGGSSGILLSIFFTATATSMTNDEPWSSHAIAKGIDGVMHYGGAKLGERTMLDAMIPAMEAWDNGLGAATRAAEAGVENTKNIEKTDAGRSSYVPGDKLRGRADPGAYAIALVLKACLSLD